MALYIDLAATDAAVAAIRGALEPGPDRTGGFVGALGPGPARLSEAITAVAACQTNVPAKIELIASGIESGASATRAADVLVGLTQQTAD